MRKPMVAGNWKMNGSRHQAAALVDAIKQDAATFSAIDVVVFPSFVHLQLVEAVLANTSVAWGAQNIYTDAAGAFTGEVSGAMLVDYGCQYVLVGHSERRMLFHENVALVAAKFRAAQSVGLKPVLCLGETLAEYEQGQTEAVIAAQLLPVIQAAGVAAFQQAVIAYEPVWAIGTGLTATPEQAQKAHAFIRQLIMQHDAKISSTIQILYGGSVKPDNAAGLFAMPDIDGALVGGASLDATSFLEIGRKV